MEYAIASTKDVASAEMIGLEKDGKGILLANVGGKYYAIGNVCTHKGCKLSGGILSGDRVQCPCHGSTFDVKNGAVVRGPAKDPEPSFSTRVAGDQIMVTV